MEAINCSKSNYPSYSVRELFNCIRDSCYSIQFEEVKRRQLVYPKFKEGVSVYRWEYLDHESF